MAVEDDRPAHGLESREPTLEDLRDLCRALNAMSGTSSSSASPSAAGDNRRTMDVDLLVATDADNESRLFDGLATLPDQAARELQPGELQRYSVIRVADEILVDLMRSAGGIAYAEAASLSGIGRRVPVEASTARKGDPAATATVSVKGPGSAPMRRESVGATGRGCRLTCSPRSYRTPP